MYMWRFPKMGVAPKSSILLGFSWGFSSINDPVIGVPPWLWKPRMEKSLVQHRAPLEVCPLLFTGPAVWNEEKPRKPSVSQVTCSEYIYIYNTRTTKSICIKKKNMPKIHIVIIPFTLYDSPEMGGIQNQTISFWGVWPWELEVLAKYGKMKGSLPEKTKLEVCSWDFDGLLWYNLFTGNNVCVCFLFGGKAKHSFFLFDVCRFSLKSILGIEIGDIELPCL